LVLDHGDHYYTVYAGTKDAVVTVGDQVQPQQKIASTGFSEIHGTQGMYFEIRHFSEPYDPKSWLKGPPL
jgi:septal ring factor EnvC (AmiA/AmiB activator)